MNKLNFIYLLVSVLVSSCYFHVCSEIERIKKDRIGAIVKEKVSKPGEHNLKYILVNNKLSSREDIYLSREQSGLWEYVIEGDSIYKEENSFKIHVFRNNESKVFNLNYHAKCH